MQIVIFLGFITGFLFADTFQTQMGECTLEIYGGKVEDIPEFTQLIKKESAKLFDEFGEVKQRPYFVYITSNMTDFIEKAKGPVPEWGIAVAKKSPDRIILKAPGIANISYIRMKEVIVHELNHVYMFRISNYNTIPSWFKEGMAMHSSNEFSLIHKIEISKANWKGKLIPLQKLKVMNVQSPKKIKLAYGESAAAVEALEYYYGEKIPAQILDRMRSGQDFQEALELSIGEQYIEFQLKFEVYLEENYNWVFLLRSSNYIYVILPLILVLGYFYHRHRNKLKLRQWEIEEEFAETEWQEELPN